ncbi:MAG: hypothetical protein IPH45_02350 [Bacteroidales bacterium]|nr:hypothetical protein [Bacteroidales bacterium]MBK7172054.1 hypothetical protein [Bacteroidales bacterium]
MLKTIRENHSLLLQKFPPSEACSCEICQSYCQRPGWWTVAQASDAIAAGFANRMMLEMAPEGTFSVLSPAFKGNEVNFALEVYATQGCTFFSGGLCELFGTGHEPLECRFCHHERKGEGLECHAEIEKDWNSPDAKRLIVQWGNLTGFWARQGLIVKEKP